MLFIAWVQQAAALLAYEALPLLQYAQHLQAVVVSMKGAQLIAIVAILSPARAPPFLRRVWLPFAAL
jgi:hypothetical protein